MIESDASIVAVSRIPGHSDIKTTMRYAHPEDSQKDALENLASSVKLIPPKLPPMKILAKLLSCKLLCKLLKLLNIEAA